MEDVVGLAQLLVPLQRLTALHGSAESAWLEAAFAQPISEDMLGELSRRFIRHLDDIDRVVPPARNPLDLLGESILKYFDGHGILTRTHPHALASDLSLKIVTHLTITSGLRYIHGDDRRVRRAHGLPTPVRCGATVYGLPTCVSPTPTLTSTPTSSPTQV